MERISKSVYSKELREEAVKQVTEVGLTVKEAGQRLSIAPSTIAYWVTAKKADKLGDIGKRQKPLTEIEMELARVKRELAEVKIVDSQQYFLPDIGPPRE